MARDDYHGLEAKRSSTAQALKRGVVPLHTEHSIGTVREVIEWPQAGSAKRYPLGGWWVVEHSEKSRGYFPLAGPFKTRAEAEHKLSALTT